MKKISGNKLLVKALSEEQVDTIFGYPGACTIDISDELYKQDYTKVILPRQEVALVHEADAYARSTGKVGVCLVTSGPGATNLVTGLATAYYDSVPLVCFTGQVSRHLIGNDAFQEVDIVGITRSITKYGVTVRNREDLGRIIKEAFYIARTGRPGPVLVDLPKDVMGELGNAEYPKEVNIRGYKPNTHVHVGQLKRAIKMLSKAKKPLFLAGGGVNIAHANEEFTKLVDMTNVPVVTTVMGRGAIPTTHPLYIGNLGMHGAYACNMAVNECDLLFSIGTRFNDRITGKLHSFAPNAQIVHIDIDRAEVDKNIIVDLGIGGDVKEALQELLPMLETKSNGEWQKRIEALKQEEAQQFERTVSLDTLNPYTLITEVQKYTTPDMPIATDVGQHQMWVAQYYQFNKPRTFITSGGLGTMGFGMGAAIGSALATGKKTVLFTGDGSFGMNMNELSTLSKLQAPVVIIIMNNGVLGMVRQWQNLFFDKHYSQTNLSGMPDYQKLADAFGIPSYRITNMDELHKNIEKAMHTNGPVLVDCLIDKDEMVLPMLPPGGSFDDIITEMEEN